VFLVPQVTAIAIAETVAVAYFLRYFKDQIGRAIFWTIIILPPVLFLTGIFGPQIIKSTASEFVYMDPRFFIFRVIGTAGWVAADFVIAYAYILVAKNLGRQFTSSRNKIINYLIIAAFSTILVSPATNNWITNNSYPPFGAIARAFLVFASFLFSIGIYSVALSVAQDSELRHLARKYVKEYALLGTLGNAQDNAEIMRKIVKHIHQHADAMEKETAVESSMLDDIEVRHYLDLVIMQTGGKKD
jgi:predicted small metal-binding protein